MLDAEIEQIARLFENRVIDPADPRRLTSRAQGAAIAVALKSTLTGFALRQVVLREPEPPIALARSACLALAALADDAGGRRGPALAARRSE